MPRAAKILLIALLLPAIVVGLLTAHFLLTPLTPPAGTTLEIRHGEPFATIARHLAAAGVVAGDRPLRLLARWRGDAGRVQAGRYAFSAPATPDAVLDRLVAGDVVRTTVTIPEGWTLREIAARLDEKGLADQRELLRQAGNADFLRTLGIPAATLEGYLFPETYSFAAGTPPRRILAMMVEEFRRRITPDMLSGARAQGLDLHQLVTLASIVQKEAGSTTEMPLIAAVFHNRLRRHMPLQADPTVIYGIADFNGNLTRADLEQKTPYNTYRIAGLPPGPIASPGTAALEAAAHPAAVDYLYFVARGDGSHVFSTTLAEHNRAVRRYQLHR
jgi:peptidoglycan lytic transglycosylase G